MRTFILQIAFFISFQTLFSQLSVSGIVKDSISAETLAGAIIGIENTQLGKVSLSDGTFAFSNLKPGEYKLVVSLLGYETRVLPITLLSNSREIEIRLAPKTLLQEEITITAIRNGNETPFAGQTLTKTDLQKVNLGQDLPYLLNMTPSVVVTSDAGAGVGYTGIRIRGSDATRVNITINSIPLNDAESQGTYFVDLPDFASSTEDIQIQRGVGSSTNGAGAFGASVNIRTDNLQNEAYAELNSSAGSFHTLKNNIRIGTGLLSPAPGSTSRYAFAGRLSSITSDGYIDRATSNLKSYFLSGGWFTQKAMLKFIVLSGKEKTYQAWYGVPEDSLATNRTYNEKTYKNEVDDYGQDHYQLHGSFDPAKNLNLNLALHYTKGKGFYEQYKNGETLSEYGIDTVFTGNDTILHSDLIRRLWLDNHFFGFTFSGNYMPPGKKWQLQFGGAGNQYRGKHFGDVIWARNAGNSEIGQRYFENDATKNDLNGFAKAKWNASNKLAFFADLQLRLVHYSFLGFDRLGNNVEQNAGLLFFNPKAGVILNPSLRTQFFFSVAKASREPNRDDYVQSSPDSRAKAEKLYDTEGGFRYSGKKISTVATAYFMKYKNQLVLTGEINDVGAYNRSNIENSYRGGIELEATLLLPKKFYLSANATFSQNKVLYYNEFIDDYDQGVQIQNSYKQSDIAFSPSLIAAGRLEWKGIKGLSLMLQSKYIGKQYLDNTSNESRSIKAYATQDFIAAYTFKPAFMKEISLRLMLNNLLDAKYVSNGYTYSYISDGSLQTFNYYFPQAGRNFLVGVSLRF